MKHLHDMKGQPRCLMFLVRGDRRLNLVTYADGSFGISRDGDLLGIWEPNEEEECVAAFSKFADFKGVFPQVILRRAQFPPPARDHDLN